MTKSQKELQKMQQYEKMVKAGKSVYLHLFNSAPANAITKAAGNLRETYRQTVKELSLSGLDETKKGLVQLELKQAAHAELAQVVAAERQRIAGRVDRLKQNYDAADRRRRIETDRETTRYNRRLEGMTDTEIKSEGAAVLNGKEISPDQFDILSREIKRIDPHFHKNLREKADELHAYAPYLNTDEGKELMKFDKALQASARGEQFPIMTDDGYQLIGLDEILQAEV